jgi:peptidoglycan biosynthesis protein MviN/MurJ (putative lipid II flippase)
VVLRAQIVRVVLGAGGFGWDETRLVAAVLAALVVACVAQGLVLLFARASYAAGDTWRPFWANLTGALVTAGLGLALPAYLAASPSARAALAGAFRLEGVRGAEVVSLGLASTAGALVAATILVWAIARRNPLGGVGLGRASLHAALASGWGAIAAYIALGLADPLFDNAYALAVFAHGAVAGAVGLAAWAYALKAMGNLEVEVALAALRRRVWKAPVVAPDTTPNQAPGA